MDGRRPLFMAFRAAMLRAHAKPPFPVLSENQLPPQAVSLLIIDSNCLLFCSWVLVSQALGQSVSKTVREVAVFSIAGVFDGLWCLRPHAC